MGTTARGKVDGRAELGLIYPDSYALPDLVEKEH